MERCLSKMTTKIPRGCESPAPPHPLLLLAHRGRRRGYKACGKTLPSHLGCWGKERETSVSKPMSTLARFLLIWGLTESHWAAAGNSVEGRNHILSKCFHILILQAGPWLGSRSKIHVHVSCGKNSSSITLRYTQPGYVKRESLGSSTWPFNCCHEGQGCRQS